MDTVQCSAAPPLAPGEQGVGHVSEEVVAALLPFCRALPKAELHAHLNGCIRDATILCVAAGMHRLGAVSALEA